MRTCGFQAAAARGINAQWFLTENPATTRTCGDDLINMKGWWRGDDKAIEGGGLQRLVQIAECGCQGTFRRSFLLAVSTRIETAHGAAERTEIACMAFPGGAETNAAQVSGAGTINLGEEQLGLRLRPALRTPGVSVVVPVRVVGSLADPQTSIDAGISAEGVANSVVGGISSLARNPLGALAGAATSAVSSNDPCPSALASARAAMPDSK